MEGLEDMKELMKRCWHNDSWERPTFKDCSNKTEKIFSCHKSQIVPAVRQVQDVLMMMASSPSDESRPSVSVPTPAAAESSHLHTFPPPSLGVSEQFQTLRYEDRPSRENEAVLQRNMRQTEDQQGPGTPQPCSVSMGPRQPQQPLYGFPGGSINIVGPCSAIQIGHNNSMKVTKVRVEKKKKKK